MPSSAVPSQSLSAPSQTSTLPGKFAGSASSQSVPFPTVPAGGPEQVLTGTAEASPNVSPSASGHQLENTIPSSAVPSQSLSAPSQTSALPGKSAGSPSSQSTQELEPSPSPSTLSGVAALQSSSRPVQATSTAPGWTAGFASSQSTQTVLPSP